MIWLQRWRGMWWRVRTQRWRTYIYIYIYVVAGVGRPVDVRQAMSVTDGLPTTSAARLFTAMRGLRSTSAVIISLRTGRPGDLWHPIKSWRARRRIFSTPAHVWAYIMYTPSQVYIIYINIAVMQYIYNKITAREVYRTHNAILLYIHIYCVR